MTRIFLSGMNSLPRQLPSSARSRFVRSFVPTSSAIVLLESFFALSLAQITVPHGESPQSATSMMLLPPGLRQTPSIEDGSSLGALTLTAPANASADTIDVANSRTSSGSTSAFPRRGPHSLPPIVFGAPFPERRGEFAIPMRPLATATTCFMAPSDVRRSARRVGSWAKSGLFGTPVAP